VQPEARLTPRLNEVGDVVLEDVRQLRALADPHRLATFDWLQKHGSRTVEDLSAALRLPVEEAQASVDVLASAGLVEERNGSWVAAGRGVFLPAALEDAEASAAARALGVVMLRAVAGVPQRWLDEVEPALDPVWAGAAGLFNAGVVLTPGELERVQQELERVLEPYLKRAEADRPDGAGTVRILAWFLPGDVARDARTAR
jgi:DNA-binding transcriptional ArsR family regulator